MLKLPEAANYITFQRINGKVFEVYLDYSDDRSYVIEGQSRDLIISVDASSNVVDANGKSVGRLILTDSRMMLWGYTRSTYESKMTVMPYSRDIYDMEAYFASVIYEEQYK